MLSFTFHQGEYFIEEYFQILSVPMFLIAGYWHFPQTIYFLVSNLLGRHIGKVDRSFA